MADSNITKRALASALKELMNEMPFAKISVSNICEKCDMNRKSFYYHFKDKYDLANWIFDTEFMAIAKKHSYGTTWDFFEDFCNYFYENKRFYRKLLKVEGQNSFSEHFREIIQPALRKRVEDVMDSREVHPFYINFFTDAVICIIVRWLSERDCMPPNEFISRLKFLVESGAVYVCRNMNTENGAEE